MGIGKRRKALRTNLLRVLWPNEEGYVEEELKFRSPGRDPLRSASDRLYTTIEGEIVYNEAAYYRPDLGTHVVIEYEGEEVSDSSEGVFPVTSQIIKLVPLPPGEGDFPIFSTSGIFQPDKWAEKIEEIKNDILAPERFIGTVNPTTLPDGTVIPGVEVLPTDRVTNGLVYRRAARGEGLGVGAPVFYDSTFEYNTPNRYEETSGINFGDVTTLVGDVRPEYNFYVREYEEIISDAEVYTYPCMYTFVSEKESDYTDEDNSVYNQHISLNGRIEGVFKDVTNKRGERIGEKDVGIFDYFSSWSDGLRQTFDSSNIEDENLFNKFQNMIFSQSDVDFLNTIAEKKESFPMTNEIRFSTGVATQTSDVLKESNLFADLIAYALTAEANLIPYAEETETGILSKKEYSVIDLTDWWGSIGTPRVVDNAIVFGRNKTSETDILNSDVFAGPVGFLLKIVFLGKIRNLIAEHSRTFKQAFEEASIAHSETLVYEIEKYKIDATGDSALQKIFIPNSSDLDLCRFIDTQVEYDTEYQYRIFVHQIVYGMKYSYYPEESETQAYNALGIPAASTLFDDQFYTEIELPRFRVESQPHLELVRAPYFTSRTVKILDKPPVAPDVNFIPYKGIPDLILMNLNAGTGDYILNPEDHYIDDRDLEDKRVLAAMQQYNGMVPRSKRGFVNYGTDDPPQEFQIFRIAQKPTSYQDFSDNLLTTISTQDGLENLAAVSFVDNVLPNVKYYYTFSVVDVHEQASFPSPIYQIEMVEEDGAVYLLVDVLDLEEERIRKNSMAMNNLIYIKPSSRHGRVNFDETNNLAGDIDSAKELEKDDIVMGAGSEEGLWDKRFKFRFISKSSGKKFDINARFRYIFNVEKDKERGKRRKKGAQRRRAVKPSKSSTSSISSITSDDK